MTPEGVSPEAWQTMLEEDYRSIASSPAFIDLLAYIDLRREQALADAEDSTDVNYAYGLLKSAGICKTIRTYVDSMTSLSE